MWNLYDFKSTEVSSIGEPYLSAKVQQEYNCDDETVRLIASSHHSENMGGGDIVYSDYSVKLEWQSVAPGSVNEYLLKLACGKY